jgi:hypothetical protein
MPSFQLAAVAKARPWQKVQQTHFSFPQILQAFGEGNLNILSILNICKIQLFYI